MQPAWSGNLSRSVGLDEWMSSQYGRPFSWGTCDCTTWVLEWLAVVTGDRTIDAVRGMYHTEEEAAAFHAGYGRDLLQTLRDAGGVVVSEANADPGDVVLVKCNGDRWWRGHLCLGGLFAAPHPGHGVAPAPMRLLRARTGWRVVAIRLGAGGGTQCLR